MNNAHNKIPTIPLVAHKLLELVHLRLQHLVSLLVDLGLFVVAVVLGVARDGPAYAPKCVQHVRVVQALVDVDLAQLVDLQVVAELRVVGALVERQRKRSGGSGLKVQGNGRVLDCTERRRDWANF